MSLHWIYIQCILYIIRVEILNMNFSITDGLKIVSKTKTKKVMVYDGSGIKLCISCTVNIESIKTVYKETIELQLIVSFNAGFR